MPNRNSAPAEYTRFFAVRLSPEQDDAIRARADADGRTIAELVRQALADYLGARREEVRRN